MIIEGGITIEGGALIGPADIPPVTVTETFTSSGTLTMPTQGTLLSATMLLIAGGGSGGWSSGSSYAVKAGGGGGAGGYLNVDVTANLAIGQTYTITVGAGGIAYTDLTRGGGTNGDNSVALGYTAIGGGRGAWSDGFGGSNGQTGGSGGGGGTGGGSAGGATSGQGYAGGAGQLSDTGTGGGGGGAGAAGSTGALGGGGGAGASNNISGTSITYAVGGGGGNGATNTQGSYSTTPGSGGAGAGTGFGDVNPTSWATAGQNGICIVRYTYSKV